MIGVDEAQRWARVLRELSAAAALTAITLFLVYEVVVDLRPKLDFLPSIAAALAAHRAAEPESLYISRETCRTLKALAKQDPGGCERRVIVAP